nr:hypothetical protein [uncultured Acetatifactor sp.]
MEICDKFLCVNRKNKECHVPKNVVAFTCKHTNAPCPKARCEYCDIKECEKQYDGRIDRMSMISEQTKELREIATNWNPNIPINPVSVVLNKAADTIESLSAKLQAANMERSERYYNGGWILCESGKLPDKEVICCDVCGEIIIGYIHETYESEQTGFSAENSHEYMYNCVKWMEKPKL